jgi:hypothetical protein
MFNLFFRVIAFLIFLQFSTFVFSSDACPPIQPSCNQLSCTPIPNTDIASVFLGGVAAYNTPSGDCSAAVASDPCNISFAAYDAALLACNPPPVTCPNGTPAPSGDVSLCGTGCSQPLNSAGLCDDGCIKGTSRVQVSDGTTMCTSNGTASGATGSGTAGSGTAGSGTAGSGTAGSGTAGSSKTCSDGTVVSPPATCPVSNTTTCSDGTVVSPPATCPDASGNRVCSNGKTISASLSCPSTATASGSTTGSTTGAFDLSYVTNGFNSVLQAIAYLPRYIVYKLSYFFNYGLTYLIGYVTNSVNSFIQTCISLAKSFVTTLITLTGISTAFNGLPSSLLYILGVFKVNLLLTSFISAVTIRFLIRRLPFVG